MSRPSIPDLALDGPELDEFLEFVREVPGRIAAVEVSDPRVTMALIERLRATAAIPLHEIALAPPLEIADRIGPHAAEDCIVALAGLDASLAFESEEAAIKFWRGLNYQREVLAPGKVRCCLFLNRENQRRMAIHAIDLRNWTREYIFLEEERSSNAPSLPTR